ncbi:dihydrodipicolinate synthase family protein [Brucella gallinifaecis]|uniref:Dihydrodipicolinate synthase family protein n=1 Tax=Brucella gallinifaecis TaxID=215590 RepID=A0A502BNJ9_9HYPH|nr:dihydrodipicolinate synthase family protein [Brucella gallinifaecis]TPF75387.1 dihydrodipicolinate synthase family protein [Brucella gallinifaecis]
MSYLQGLSGFPITPTNAKGSVDVAQLRMLIARLVGAGVDSIGLLGSTGTYMYLSREERLRAVEAAIGEASGKTPVVIGIGALRTDEVVRLAQDAKGAGAVAGLLAPVSYTPLTEDEVFDHYTTVARKSGLPIIIYNNHATTHFSFSPALIGRLSREPGIVGIKNPAPMDDAAREIAEQRSSVSEGFSLGYSGDWDSVEALIAGADVWYSVLGGLFPDVCLKITRAAQSGDVSEARRLNAQLAPLWDILRQYSSLRTIYAIADLLDIVHAEPSRPIKPVSDEVRVRIAEALADIGELQ